MKTRSLWLLAMPFVALISCNDPLTRDIHYTGTIHTSLDDPTPVSGVEMSYGYSTFTDVTGADGKFVLKGSEEIRVASGEGIQPVYMGLSSDVISPKDPSERFNFGVVYLDAYIPVKLRFNGADTLTIENGDYLKMEYNIGHAFPMDDINFDVDLLDGNWSDVIELPADGISKSTFNGIEMYVRFHDADNQQYAAFRPMNASVDPSYNITSRDTLMIDLYIDL